MGDKEQSGELKTQSDECRTLDIIDNIVSKNYLRNLSQLLIKDLPENLRNRKAGNSACMFPVKRIVYDREENNLQKMMNIYVGAASIEASLVIIIHHPEVGKDVEMYLGVCDEENRDLANAKANIFYNNLMGNFPGCQTGRREKQFLTPDEVDKLVDACLTSDEYHAVSCVSGVASLREGMKQENAAFFQGIEKLIDGMENRAYSAIILANSISDEMIADMQAEYENLYNMISPHAKVSISLSHSDSESLSKTLSEATSETLSHTRSTTLSVGESRSNSSSKGSSRSSDDSIGINAGINRGGNIGVKVGPLDIGANAGFSVGANYSHSWSRGENWNKTTTIGTTDTVADTKADTEGTTMTFSSSEGKSLSVTFGHSQQLTYENKTVQDLMSTIDQKIKRFHVGMEHGMFAVSAYFVSASMQGVKSAASIYKSIIAGDNSQIESSAINAWQDDSYESLKSYLCRLCHPVFSLYDQVNVTPASIVTAGELAIHMGLPKKSVTGIPVSYSVSFGRNIHNLSDAYCHKKEQAKRSINIGQIYHLGMPSNNEALLDLDSFSMHSLLCGTTGAGKSNTSYLILKHLPEDVSFLVVEPTKGEYKDAMQDMKGGVSVYGTNPILSPMLRMNPFRFCEKVHVLEHLDRMLSIFNVCWPMEAAMPAVLKEALERAYIGAGWDIKRSTNVCSDLIFPSFEDVMREVQNIMQESDYSDENKRNYIGALCTRLRELTTGLNKLIFCANDLSDEELFDKNVIVDLSRIGSTETRALIMGLILIRLQEYRQSKADKANASLRHVTVLEEAHHLLRRTSMEQSMDGANLMGRSVEMISNAFAEMRTYGEGFLIVDQSPEQLDKSVIRNTNTKIVMRLPEYGDRELVGKAMGLSEEQISELAKLPTGIAAVYQNNWLDAVLVKTPREDMPKDSFQYEVDEGTVFRDEKEEELHSALLYGRPYEFELWLKGLGERPIPVIASLQIPTKLKRAIIEYYIHVDDNSSSQQAMDALSQVAYEFFHAEDAFRKAILTESSDIGEFEKNVLNGLWPSPTRCDHPDSLFAMLTFEYQRQNGKLEKVIEAILSYSDEIVERKAL